MSLALLALKGAKTGAKFLAANKRQDAMFEKRGKMMEEDYNRATAKNDFLMKESAKKSAQIGMERTEQNIRASQSLAKTKGKTNMLQGQSQQAQAMSGQIGASADVAANDIMRQESASLASGMYNNEVAHMNLNNKAMALHDTSINQFTDMRTTGGGGSPNLGGAMLINDIASLISSPDLISMFDKYLYPGSKGGSMVDLTGSVTGLGLL